MVDTEGSWLAPTQRRGQPLSWTYEVRGDSRRDGELLDALVGPTLFAALFEPIRLAH